MKRSVFFCSLFCTTLFALAISTPAQKEHSERLASLTAEIAGRTAYGRAGEPEFTAAAKARYRLMSKLAETDPKAVLDNALANEILDRIPAKSKGYFEKRDTLRGELEVLAECDEQTGRIRRSIKRGEDRFKLDFADDLSQQMLNGTEVTASGVLIGDRLVLESRGMTLADAKMSEDVTASALTPAVGEVKVLVVLVNFQDRATEPYTREQANNLVFNQTDPASITNFFTEMSYGQSRVTGTATGWFTMPRSYLGACDQYYAIADFGLRSATNSGININAYQKYVFAFPDIGCGYSGMGEVGGSRVWLDGALNIKTTSHELGHTLGLEHSRGYRCAETCTTSEYGHIADVMGQGKGHYHPYQKERLGWLQPNEVTSPGVYQIEALSLQTQAAKALKIPLDSDNSLSIEFRRRVGFDALNTANLDGVFITRNSRTNGLNNFMFDFTPDTLDWRDAVVPVGQEFSYAGFTIRVLSISETAATVELVNQNQVPLPTPTPIPTVTPSPSPSPTPVTTPTPVPPVSSGIGVVTSQYVYTVNDTLVVTASVKSGGMPVAGVSVAFKAVPKQGGRGVSGSSTTNSSGVAVWTYKFNPKRDNRGLFDQIASGKVGRAAFSGATVFELR